MLWYITPPRPVLSHVGLKMLCWALEVSWGVSIVPQHSGVFTALRRKVVCCCCSERSSCTCSSPLGFSELLPPQPILPLLCIIFTLLYPLICKLFCTPHTLWWGRGVEGRSSVFWRAPKDRGAEAVGCCKEASLCMVVAPEPLTVLSTQLVGFSNGRCPCLCQRC